MEFSKDDCELCASACELFAEMLSDDADSGRNSVEDAYAVAERWCTSPDNLTRFGLETASRALDAKIDEIECELEEGSEVYEEEDLRVYRSLLVKVIAAQIAALQEWSDSISADL